MKIIHEENEFTPQKFILKEDFEEIDYSDEDNWFEVASKSVPDSDGFYTDYTWYQSVDGERNIFIFGDNEIYGPDPDYADWECDDEDEAREWFDSYNGFTEEDDDIELDEAKTSYGDTTIEDYVEMNFGGDKDAKERLINWAKKRANGSDYFNGLNLSYNDWKNKAKEFGLYAKGHPVTEASDTKKIERATQSAYDALMNGATGTEDVIQGLKLIYGKIGRAHV